jgi:hypothetical protein
VRIVGVEWCLFHVFGGKGGCQFCQLSVRSLFYPKNITKLCNYIVHMIVHNSQLVSLTGWLRSTFGNSNGTSTACVDEGPDDEVAQSQDRQED